MQKHHRRPIIVVVAVAAVALLAACNPGKETVVMWEHGSSVSSGLSRLYSYNGDAPGWIQVRVTASAADTVHVSAETQQRSGPTYCMKDGAYGTDVLANCLGTGRIGSVTSPSRAAQTEGVARGWKKLIAIPANTRFIVHVDNYGTAHAASTAIEFSVVDGNNQPIGNIIESQGVG